MRDRKLKRSTSVDQAVTDQAVTDQMTPDPATLSAWQGACCKIGVFVILAVLVSSGWSNRAVAQQAESAGDGAAISPAVQPRQLARDRYVDRQRATLEMWRGRSLSRQAVQDAARHSDPEIAERAEWILKQWRSGALPGVGNVSGGMLLDRGSPSALAAVLEQGAFDAVLVAVEESAGTIEFDQIKKRVAQQLIQRYPFYCDHAFANGTESNLLRLLDAVAVDRNVAAATGDLMDYLGVEVNDANRLPSAAAVWLPKERDIYLAQLAMLDGDAERSMEAARRTADPVLLRITQMLAQRWDLIAKNAMEVAENAANDEERVESLSWALAAAYRTKDQALFQKVTEQLRDAKADESARQINLRWRSLAMHGDVDTAIDVLAVSDPAAAAKVACAASRYERGAKLCGFELESIDQNLDDWISDAYVEQAEFPAGEMAPAMERLYALARLLVNVGESDNALRIYRRLTPRQIIVSPYGTSLREQTLRELSMVNRFDWLLDIAVAPGENAATQRTYFIVAGTLGTESESFRAVLDRIKLVMPRSDFRERFRATFQLFRGKTPDSFDVDNDFQRLYDALLHHQPSGLAGSTQRGAISLQPLAIDMEVIDMFIRHGQVELARDGLALLVGEGEIDALLASAETQMEQGDAQAADRFWRQAAVKSAEFHPAAAGAVLDHGLAYAKTVAGQWVLAKRSGHHEQADQLEQRIRLMMTSPSLTFRQEFADHLKQLGHYELAIEVLRDLVVLASFGGDEAPDFFKVAVTYVGVLDDFKESNPDGATKLNLGPQEIVRWSDVAIFGILESDIYYDTAFISVPLSIRKTFLQHAIETKDESLARQAIDQIQSIDPLNIDYGERMLPELKKAGMESLAASALDALIENGLRHVGRFKSDSTALNNLAWTAAMNGRQLEQALELSERAVFMEPDSVVFRDTLAEVLHLLGRTEEALAIESACLLDEPDEWHLHEQIDKYRKLLKK